MARSNISRIRKSARKMIYNTADFPDWERNALHNGENKRVDMQGKDAPPYKVGKQFPYENDRRAGKTHPDMVEMIGINDPRHKVNVR